MDDIKCANCGFIFSENNADKCYMTKEIIDPAMARECRTFIVRQYDGGEPFTPEQHEWLFRDNLAKKQMKKIQGLRF